jgi:hypothetical protein
MRVAIIGAGLAGSIASGACQSYSPKNFEAKNDGQAGIAGHKAVLRVRNHEVAGYLGCHISEIEVTKEIFIDGQATSTPTIKANNLYSLKAYGDIGHRSLNKLGKVHRFLIDGNIRPSNCLYGHKLVGVEKGRLFFDVNGVEVVEEYDYCISTIPLPALLKVAYPDIDLRQFSGKEICVADGMLKDGIRCTTNQTIYFPEAKFKTYRATLQMGKIIIEAVGEVGMLEMEIILAQFGLKPCDFGLMTTHRMPQGKMLEVDNDFRKGVILDLSQDFNIFSFGRFAIWKPIRTDHLVGDIKHIMKMMNISEANKKYHAKLEAQ